MKFKNNIFTLVILLSLSFMFSCAELEVEYLNKPDTELSLGDPLTVYNISRSTVYNWYMINTSSISPRLAMWVASDQGTSSWANRGMYDFSKEPREVFNNLPSYTRAGDFAAYWEDMYANLSQTNDVLNVINDGMQIGEIKDEIGEDTEMVKAVSYFIQGLSLGYLGLVYDKAYIMLDGMTTEEAELVETSPYAEVVQAALVSLDKAIAVCEANEFTIPVDWFNGSEYTNEELAQLAHTFAARFIIQKSRTAAENESTNWADVLFHAEKGIQRNLEFYMDNNRWINWFYNYAVQPTWASIDLRIINLMDNSYPSRYPDDGIAPDPKAVSDDLRLESDLEYIEKVTFKPERGFYHFSNYEYSRYDYMRVDGVREGTLIDVHVTENELMKAEALMHLGRKADAVEIINNSTRTTRGGLQNVSSMFSDEMLLDAIFYERDIELIMSGFAISFFDMRRRDMLQIGTPLHLPIPGSQLMVMSQDIYTFGGVENADGINTSNGGWF
ncbi:MAG: RagB/SusD family nutrient uptake outer membrane protein [Bacteroidota bacterium]